MIMLCGIGLSHRSILDSTLGPSLLTASAETPRVPRSATSPLWVACRCNCRYPRVDPSAAIPAGTRTAAPSSVSVPFPVQLMLTVSIRVSGQSCGAVDWYAKSQNIMLPPSNRKFKQLQGLYTISNVCCLLWSGSQRVLGLKEKNWKIK